LRQFGIEDQDVPKILSVINELKGGKNYETTYDLLADVDLVDKYQMKFESQGIHTIIDFAGLTEEDFDEL
jgi:hypothetical protein